MDSSHTLKSSHSFSYHKHEHSIGSSKFDASSHQSKEEEVEHRVDGVVRVLFAQAKQPTLNQNASPSPSPFPTLSAAAADDSSLRSSNISPSSLAAATHFPSISSSTSAATAAASSNALDANLSFSRENSPSPATEESPQFQQANISSPTKPEEILQKLINEAQIQPAELKHFLEVTRVSPLKAWAFFIDGDRWERALKEKNPFLTFDQKEPGYMKAMIRAFDFLFRFEKGTFLLTAQTYEQLHDIAVADVQSKNELLEKGFRRDRSQAESFGLTESTYSREGGEELENRKKSETYNYHIEGYTDSYHVLKGYISFTYKDKSTPQAHTTPRQADATPTQADATPTKAAATPTKAAATPTQSKQKTPSKKIDLTLVPEAVSLKPINKKDCEEKVAHCMNIYQQSISVAKTNEEKLRAIVRLCQDLDQIHVFVDGNIRTVNLLLNRLLYDNNLDFTCLWDPNCLDCLSEQELIQKVKEGQDLFLKLLS